MKTRPTLRPTTLRTRSDTPLTANTTTNDDIRQLRAALRGTLGTTADDVVPTVDADWRSRWTAFADLGVTAFCVPEEKGGFGLQVDAAVAAATEFGAALHGSPYAGLTACIHAVAHLGDPASNDLVASMLAGEAIGAFGRIGRDGKAHAVDGGADADVLLLVDAASDSMLLVADRTAWSVLPSPASFDVSRACADVSVEPTRSQRIPISSQSQSLFGLLLAADAVGGVQRMLDRTIAYATQRTAFGRPIGGFQAVQHRLVDHSVRARGMTLLIDEAARRLSLGDEGARRSVALAEHAVSAGAAHILHDLLQLTGAIGFTWEHGLHYYSRRAHHDARLSANPRAAARTLASIEGWSDDR